MNPRAAIDRVIWLCELQAAWSSNAGPIWVVGNNGTILEQKPWRDGEETVTVFKNSTP
jgi:hypothetical protein